MKKLILSVAFSIATANAAGLNLKDYIFKDNSTLGKAHGGDKSDIDALEDGVGVKIINFKTSSESINLKEYSKLVFKNGRQAKNLGLDIYEFSGEDASKIEKKGGSFIAQLKA